MKTWKNFTAAVLTAITVLPTPLAVQASDALPNSPETVEIEQIEPRFRIR